MTAGFSLQVLPKFIERGRMGKIGCSLLVLFLLFSSLLLPQFLFAQSNSLHGIDVSDLDRQADPCNDFYEFANGTWRAKNPIPASMDRWSKRWAAGESSKDKLKEILEITAADHNAPQGSNEQIIGDYYGACMDESRVNARGMEPLKPGLPGSMPRKI
jgi:putative endopeptidase